MTMFRPEGEHSPETMGDRAERDPPSSRLPDRGGRVSATVLLADCLLDVLEHFCADTPEYCALVDELKPKLEGILRGRPR